MENLNAKNLETAIKNIDPSKAEPLAAKYKLVMDSIGSGLVDNKSEIAKSSKSYLEGLASDLISNSIMSSENQNFSVEALDRELDNVASALGLKLENINAKDVVESFDKIGNIFKELHLEFRESDYIAAYIKNAVPLKLDVSDLSKSISKVWEKSVNSNFLKSYLYENQDQLFTIVGQFSNGHEMEAFDNLNTLKSQIDALFDPEILKQRTGIVLPDAHVQELMGTLSVNQMTESQIFDALNKAKEVDPVSFSKIRLDPTNMVRFLVGLVLDLKNGKRKNAENGLKIEATASVLDEKKSSEISEYTAKLERNLVSLKDYKEKNPEILTNAYIINAERNIAVLKANIALTRFQQFRVNVQRYMVSAYAENSEHKTDLNLVIQEVFKKVSANGLREVAAKYKIQLPPDFAMLEKMDLDYQSCKIDSLLKGELNDMSPDGKKLYSEFYQQFSEGKLDTAEKKDVALHQIYEESRGLAFLSDKNEALLNRDRSTIYGLIDKYGSIDKVPEAERADVASKFETYFELGGQAQKINGKLLSIYIDVELLSPDEKVGKDKTPIAQEITETRNFLLEIGGGMEDVAQFLGKKDFKAPTESEVADSQLYSMILAKDLRPFNDHFAKVTDKVVGVSNELGFSLGQLNKYGEDPEYFERLATPPTRLFKHALDAFSGMETGMMDARRDISAQKSSLEAYRNNVVNGDIDLVKKYPVLKAHLVALIDQSLNKVNFVLNNDDSPLSLVKIAELKKAHEDLKEVYDQYCIDSLWNVGKNLLIGSIIVAAAVAGGMLAAGLLVGSAAESTLIVTGVAAFGGTVGSRVGMGVTNGVGLTDFSTEEILNPKSLARDFVLSWGISFAAVNLARGAMVGLNRGAASSRVWISKSSEKFLAGIGRMRSSLSPAEWIGATEASLGKEAMKKFGVKFLTQYSQEEVENKVWEINPIIGFVASVINSTHGMNVDIEAVKATNAGVERNAIVYKTATPEEFITQMEAHCSSKGAKKFKAEIAADKTIKFIVEDSSGQVTALEVKPAISGLEPGIMIRRVAGIEQNNGVLEIRNGSDLAQSINQLQEQGFTVKVDGKTLKIRKGNLAEEVQLKFEGTPDAAVKADVLNLARELRMSVDKAGDVQIDSAEGFMSLMTLAREKGFNIVRAEDGSFKLQHGATETNVKVRLSPSANAEINALRSDYEALRIEVEKANGMEKVPQPLLDRIELAGMKLLVKLSILLSPSVAYAKDVSIADKAWAYAEAPFKAFFNSIDQGAGILALVCGGYLAKIAIYDLAYKLIYKNGSPALSGMFQNKPAIVEAVKTRKEIAEDMAGRKGKKNLDAEIKTIGDSLVIELDKFVSYLRKNEYGIFEVSAIRSSELDAISTKGKDILERYKKDPTSVTREELVDFEAMVKEFSNKVENARNSGILVKDDWKMNKIVRVSVAALILLFYMNLKNELGKAGSGGSSDSSETPVAPPPDIQLPPVAPPPDIQLNPEAPKPAETAPAPEPAPSADDDGPRAVPPPAQAPANPESNSKPAPEKRAEEPEPDLSKSQTKPF